MSSAIELRKLPLIFVEDLSKPKIGEVDFHHLSKSLRIELGSVIAISDGRGSWSKAKLGENLELVSDAVVEPQTGESCVCFTPVKNERPEYVIQKLTELGISRIIPLVTERSIIRWDESKIEKLMAKWTSVAKQACMQSRRVWFPTIERPHPVADLPVTVAPQPLLVADPTGRQITTEDSCIAIGPEGGFTEAELNLGERVCLPGGILRAETAAVAAATLLSAR